MVTKKKQPLDFARNARFTAISLFVTSPIAHYYTARLLPAILPVTGKASLIRKVVFDQTVAATCFIAVFFVGISILEGKGIRAGVENLKGKYWITLKSSWALWPAANVINFGFVPIKFQVLFAGVVSFFWNVFLSYVQNFRQPKTSASS